MIIIIVMVNTNQYVID